MARYPNTSIIYGSDPDDPGFLREGTDPSEVEYFTGLMDSIIRYVDQLKQWGSPSAVVRNGPHPYDLNQDDVIDLVDAAMASAWLGARSADSDVSPPYDTPTGDWPTNNRDWNRLSLSQKREALRAILTEHPAVRDLAGGDRGLPAVTGGGKDYRFMDANGDRWVSYLDYELLFGEPFTPPDVPVDPFPAPTPHPNPPDPHPVRPDPDPGPPDPVLAPLWARLPVLVFGGLIALAIWLSLKGRSVWDL